MNNIEPRLVIPFRLVEQGDAGEKVFLNVIKELGAAEQEQEDKLVIKESGLPSDDMDVVVLKPSTE